MTPQEAYEQLKIIMAYGISNCLADKMARDVTFKALEKQISQRPLGMSVCYEGRLGNCPDCNSLVYEEFDKVGCRVCLQRLDWSR